MFFLFTGVMSWYYYVTMPMPASTFTIAVGCWQEVKQQCFTAATETEDVFSVPFSQADFRLVFGILLRSDFLLPGDIFSMEGEHKSFQYRNQNRTCFIFLDGIKTELVSSY